MECSNVYQARARIDAFSLLIHFGNENPAEIKANLESGELSEIALAGHMLSEFRKNIPTTRKRMFETAEVQEGEVPERIIIDYFKVPPVYFEDSAAFKFPPLLR